MDELLSIPDFMREMEIRGRALKVARLNIDVECERGKKTKSNEVAKAVMVESINTFIDQGRQNNRHVAKELLRQPTFQSD